MVHAQTLHARHPPPRATAAVVEFVGELRHAALSHEVRHYARRHLLDTVGVMIAGAGGEVATRAEAVLAAVARRAAFRCPAARGGPRSSTPAFSARPPPPPPRPTH